MLNRINSPWPLFTQEESDAVQRVLLSNKVNYWTGDECRNFENEFANLFAAAKESSFKSIPITSLAPFTA